MEINDIIPRTNPILDILEPIIFPNANSSNPNDTDFKETNNSGREVANDTIKVPTTTLGILSLLDNATELLTKISVPMKITTQEIISLIIDSVIV